MTSVGFPERPLVETAHDPPLGEGGVTAQELVQRHMWLARTLAVRFAGRGERLEDLEQVALLALVGAARRYDAGAGASFATYAKPCVIGALKRHFRDQGWAVRPPRPVQEAYQRTKRASEELRHQRGATPTVTELAEHLGLTEAAVVEAERAGATYWAVSLDAPAGQDKPVTEVGVGEESFEAVLDRCVLEQELPTLSRRDRVILKRQFFDGWSQRRIAADLGVSQVQVSRLEARLLAKLRLSFETP